MPDHVRFYVREFGPEMTVIADALQAQYDRLNLEARKMRVVMRLEMPSRARYGTASKPKDDSVAERSPLVEACVLTLARDLHSITENQWLTYGERWNRFPKWAPGNPNNAVVSNVLLTDVAREAMTTISDSMPALPSSIQYAQRSGRYNPTFIVAIAVIHTATILK